MRVDIEVYFQKELPFPDIDLASLKMVSADKFPLEFESGGLMFHDDSIYKDVKTGTFWTRYNRLVADNLSEDNELKSHRRVMEYITKEDNYKRFHFLPSFISKVSTSDTNSLIPETDENFLEKAIQ